MRVPVIFEAEGGTLRFERNEHGIEAWMEDDSGRDAYVLFTPSQWAELCDFFAHPEVNERFDVKPYTMKDAMHDFGSSDAEVAEALERKKDAELAGEPLDPCF